MLRSIFSNWLSLIIIGVIYFVLTPVLIHSLGDFYYGMWVLAMSVLDYYGLLDLGIRTTLHRFVGRLKGMNERAALDETVATALAISIGVCFLVLGLTLALAYILPKFFVVPGAARRTFQLLVVFLGLSVGVLFPARVLGAYLCGLQRFDLYNLALISTAILRAVLIVAVLHWGFGVVHVGAVTLGIAVLTLLLNRWLVHLADPMVSLNLRRTSWARIRELSSFSFYAFLNTLGDYLRFYTDSVVIARMLSIALVTPFSVAGRLLSYFKEVVLGLAGPLMPRMSELEGQAKHSELRQLFLQGTKAVALISLSIGSLILVSGKSLLSLWLGERFVESYPLLLVLTAGYVVALGQWPSRDVLYAKGRHRPLGCWTLAEGGANLLLSVYWARKYGLFGVALGTAVPMIVVAVLVQPWYVLRLMGISLREYVQEALLRPVIATGIFLAVCAIAMRGPAHASPGGFLFSLAWQGVLLTLLAYTVGLTQSERRIALQRSKYLGGLALRFARTAAR